MAESAGWDIPRMLHGLTLSPEPAPEIARPAAREMTVNPDMPSLPQSGGIGDFIQQAVAAYAPVLMSQGKGEFLARQIEQQQEQKRRGKAAQETQALTQLFSSALASGNPETLSSAITQVSRLKGLEPETVKSLGDLQIKLGQSVGQSQEEERLAKALAASTDTELSQAVGAIIKSSPGVKISDAIKLVQSGLLGEHV